MVLSNGVSFVLSVVTVAIAVSVAMAMMFSCSSHRVLPAERGLIGRRAQHEGRRPLVRSSPRGLSSCQCMSACRVRQPQPALLSCWSPRGAFLTPFSTPPHLSTCPPSTPSLDRAQARVPLALKRPDLRLRARNCTLRGLHSTR